MYSELYDNEWTNAFEALEKIGYSEIEGIGTLRETLLVSYTVEFLSVFISIYHLPFHHLAGVIKMKKENTHNVEQVSTSIPSFLIQW